GEVQTASGMTLDKLGNSPVIQEMNSSIEAAAKHNRPLLLAGEAGSPFEIVARYLHKSGTPWVATDRVEHIVDTPMELLQ
ncbi:sigma 54-interacting transcriptional regulator, partial [Neisseria sp. P0014.S004]